MNEGDLVSGTVSTGTLAGKVVVGPLSYLDFSQFGRDYRTVGIEVVDAEGTSAVVEVENVKPAHPRRPRSVVILNG